MVGLQTSPAWRWLAALWRPSLARRLAAALLAACALVWVAIYAQGHYWTNRAEVGVYDRDLVALSGAVGEVVQAQPDPLLMRWALFGVAHRIWVDTSFDPRSISFNVWDAAGVWVAGSSNAASSALGRPEQLGFFDVGVGAAAMRVHARRIGPGDHRVEVVESFASRRTNLDAAMISAAGLGLPLLVGFPLLLAPMWLAVYSGLGPLRRLSRELAQRQPQDMQPLRTRHVYAELAPVVTEFNATLQRQAELLQRERDFLADAAHELRTPLAVISAQRDTLMTARDPQERERAAHRLDIGVQRASRLVNQLLVLARMEAPVDHDRARLDLADLVRDVLASLEHEAQPLGISLAYGGPDRLVAPCQREALESALGNLVGNAIRHGQAGGQVEVSLQTGTDGQLQLRVSDDGKGIETSDLSRLFRRFQRGRDAAAPGAGLGLAIVASAAQRMDARIEVGPGLGGRGVSFTLVWQPASSTKPADPHAPARAAVAS